MDHNPYQPPKANPGDGVMAEAGPRPRAVDIALVLLAINILFGLVGAIGAWSAVNQAMISGLDWLLQWVRLGVLVWMCFAIARGRNWARIVLLLLTALGLFNLVATMVATSRMMPIGMLFADDHMRLLILVFPALLPCVALYLLFFPGRSWFERR